METLLASLTDRRWKALSLVVFAACAIVIVAAVESGSPGHALTGASLAVLGVVNYRWPPISYFRDRRPMEPLPRALTVVALLLFFSGLLVRQAIG
jgi:predicted membrane metal-binding protein